MQNSLPSILHIIAGTPTWVWCVFGYLIFIGLRATRPRIVYIPKLFIVPLILSSIKYKVFLACPPKLWISYFACLALASFLSYRRSLQKPVTFIPEKLSVKLPGTYSTLIALIAFFLIKYVFGYMNATMPDDYLKIQIIDLAFSGLFSGYFLGKAISYFIRLKKIHPSV